MSTADIARTACELSNLRNRLNQAASTATRRVFLGMKPHPSAVIGALHDLIEDVDAVYDDLRPFAYLDDTDHERALVLSVALSYARAGDPVSAGLALAAMFDTDRKAA